MSPQTFTTTSIPPKPKVTNAQILKAFWVGIRPNAWLLSYVVVAFIVASVLGVSIPLFYKKFFDILSSSTDRNFVGASLVGTITTIAIINIVQWMIFRSSVFVVNFVQSQVMARLKQNGFNHLMIHSHSFFANNFSGSLVQKIGRFSRAFDKMTDEIMFGIIPLLVTVVGAIIITFRLAPLFSIVIFFWVLFFFLFNFLYSKKMTAYDVESAAADSKSGAALADAIGNHSAVTNFVGYEFEKNIYKTVTLEQAQKTTQAWNKREISNLFQTSLLFIVEFLVFYFAIGFWQKGLITVGTFVLVQIYIIGLSRQLWGISRIMKVFYEAFADSREMVEIMETPYEIIDIPGAKKLVISDGKIELADVAFSYGTSNKEILKGINLTVNSGEKIGLIGPSGAGKTTITRLLLRLHNVTGGAILIDNQNIAEVTQESLREKISLVPQDPVLFHRSLMENIRYGRRDATNEEVVAAAKLAHCDEFIDVLPLKYETLVGERGVKLSGGERQRIAIARAILKNAPILILDEATSSLDSHSESLIQEALDTLMRGRTAIVIAHRLSTIRKMDRIIVMENGAIREEGTHDALIKKDTSLYKKLWDLQMGGFISS